MRVSATKGRPREKRWLGTLVVVFPCVICSFTAVVMILCFCACPLLQYRLRGQVGYDYFAFLYSVLGLLVFGVVGELFLLAWRRGCFGRGCTIGHHQSQEVDEAPESPEKQRGVLVALRDDGRLKEDACLKAPLCDVHHAGRESSRGPKVDHACIRLVDTFPKWTADDILVPFSLYLKGENPSRTENMSVSSQAFSSPPTLQTVH